MIRDFEEYGGFSIDNLSIGRSDSELSVHAECWSFPTEQDAIEEFRRVERNIPSLM